ncbi:hypothetical protein MNBD_GAMMA06-467 [hydrothermal vent metagenome]|uniref:Channel-forming transporter/cytolysins activator of TpsB family n=1 Tax=hydrothermal vent metagenome TaxID=652676 RepID=A0A3B0WGK9_9ZZZZ
MHIVRITILVMIATTFFLPVANAATPAEISFQQNEQQLREQQRLLKSRERDRLLKELERSLNSIEMPEIIQQPVVVPSSDVCFEINKIIFYGTDNMLEDEARALKQPWLGKCMSLVDIDLLRSSIDKFYIEAGWIMARAYLQPDQNIKNGTLVFKILEGTLEDIKLNFNEIKERLQIAMAFPSMIDETIFIRDVEQGLDQMNRLRSNRASMTMEPVKNKPGRTNILINNVISNPYRLSLGYDNLGSKTTGDKRGVLTIDTDNLLSLNDNLYINITESLGSEVERSSNSYSMNLSIPYGYWLYTLSSNHSRYKSTNVNDTTAFVTKGESDTNTFRASRVVHRNKNSKTTAGFALNLKETETFLEDVLLETGSRKLTVTDLRLLHIARQAGHVWTAQLTYSRGLDAFDALLDDPLTGDNIPKAQFEKLSWNLTLSKPFNLGENYLSYQGFFSGQISRDALFGSEQIAIGDLYSVRGFRDSPASGDSGNYIKNDISWSPQFKTPYLKALSFSLGLDAGYVRVRNNNINNTGNSSVTLVGMAIGAQQLIRLPHDQHLSWRLDVGKGLSAPESINKSGVIAIFNLNWKFW